MPKRYIFLEEGCKPTLRKVHTSNLFDLLQLSLREENYCRATRIVEILLQCPETNVTLIWQAAVEVLTHFNYSKKVCVEFFNKLLIYTKSVSEILLELIFFQMKSGNSAEALETLETYLPQVPFCDNPLFHGYTGLLAYALWDHLGVANNISYISSNGREEVERSVIEHDDEHIMEDDEHHMEERMRYYNLSARSLKKSLDMDIRNDMFFVYYVKLLLAGEDFEEAFHIIDTFCDKNPHALTGHRIRFETLYYHRNENAEWVNAGKEYHKIDPLSPPEKVESTWFVYLSKNVKCANQSLKSERKKDEETLVNAHYNIVELFFQRVEHGDDKTYYLKKLLFHFVWLEYVHLFVHKYIVIYLCQYYGNAYVATFTLHASIRFLELKRGLIDTLLETRTSWYKSFTLNQKHKTRDHAGLYILMTVLLGGRFHEKEVNAEKFKERVLKATSLSHGNRPTKYRIDVHESSFSDQSDNEVSFESSEFHYNDYEKFDEDLSTVKEKESVLDDFFAEILNEILQ
ncbi:2872_t:CDS:2 [Acaulospora morrowiae]|uniref:2872_t:CDS:1 n=1 Tax=Acaulospora morrowiae TaxID=94023 RepID=A0A9N8WJ77_9GLOM|nr:2872_t:CDS:2 [Acaulospora morrowiae]